MLNLKPIGSYIIASPLDPPGPNHGLVIPDTARKNQSPASFWKALSVGPKVQQVIPGDIVLTSSYSQGPKQIEDDSGRWLIDERNALLVLRDPTQPEAPHANTGN